jgi:hypothetical protein
MGGACSTHRRDEKYNILVGKRPLGRPRCRWGDIRTDLMGKKGGKLWIGCIWLRIG